MQSNITNEAEGNRGHLRMQHLFILVYSSLLSVTHIHVVKATGVNHSLAHFHKPVNIHKVSKKNYYDLIQNHDFR